MTGSVKRNKRVVRRLVEEVLTGGRLDLVDELYHPRLAAPPAAGSNRSSPRSARSRCASAT